jgi:hypothetical protein
MFGGAVAIAAGLLAVGAPRVWRAAVFVPLVVGAVGLFQAKEKT